MSAPASPRRTKTKQRGWNLRSMNERELPA
jgi:hypothetical protein